jgi:ABC-2 type transport system ATP-binding protein
LTELILEVSGLVRRYGDLVAVDRLSLDVRRGEILGFLGPNGAGKTTSIHMMCGLLRPDEGSVVLDGQPLRPGASRGLRAIGVCPQSLVIWETLTCREQLVMMAQLYSLSRAHARRRADELLDVLGLTPKARKLARTLSGGMKRRLNIALALVHEPRLLFLDEPQAGLDPQSRVLVREYIRTLAGDMTIVLTTHDMEEAEKLSDRVCIIDHGKLLALDTVDGIKGQLGEGDLLEIEIAEDAETQLRPLLDELHGGAAEFTVHGQTLTFATTRATELLPDLLQGIRDRGLTLVGVGVRKRTLEDVFIRMTGRGLRT